MHSPVNFEKVGARWQAEGRGWGRKHRVAKSTWKNESTRWARRGVRAGPTLGVTCSMILQLRNAGVRRRGDIYGRPRDYNILFLQLRAPDTYPVFLECMRGPADAR